MMRLSFSVLLICLTAPTRHLHAQETPPSPEALLQKMEETYRAVRSYSDNTSARYRNPDGTDGAKVECKIWFVRPTLFRVDAESRRSETVPPKREVMWSDGRTARTWSTTSPVVMRKKIQLAGSKMFGTYAYHVPTLLEGSYGGPQRLHQLASPVFNGTEVIDGVDCYRIKGSWQGDPYEVWLGKVDSLVHKLTANYKGYEMEELHRDIRLDQPIAPSVFFFAPENETVVPPPPAKPGSSPKPNRSSATEKAR
ncbi:MAG: DUF2092 domain-containing protein [Verrucomicrobiota bacterium]|nr:DUF2092 domain-containing protein [Verrucomicrobiota bacterium]